MDTDYIKEPKDRLITYTSQVVEEIRKENNLANKKDREASIAIIDKWVKEQEHFIKNDYSKGYIERCIITCKGSIERAKKQIDKMCTMRTLMPKYFQITDIKDSEIMNIFNRAYFTIMPKLTKEYHRVVLIKVRPNADVSTPDYTTLYKLIIILAEYFKSNDYCRGFVLVADIFEHSVANVLYKINLTELQQFIPVITEGYGCKIKGIYLVTGSKVIENFLKLVKPLFSEKVRGRIHAVMSRTGMNQFLDSDILPEEYGGTEKSIEKLHNDLLDSLSSVPVQEILKEMHTAATDESKRRIDKFNEEYMGMPGTFRTLSLD